MLRYIASFIAGLLWGSFANVCIWRLPREESLWRPRSHCPHCQYQLSALDNIPLFSYAVLRGRCKKCHAGISPRYVYVEAIFGLTFLFNAWFFKEQSLSMLVLAHILMFYMLTISVIDFEHKIIPDELSLSLLVLGILFSGLNPALPGPCPWRMAYSVGAGLIGGLLMYGMAWSGEKIFKKEALGGGDIKLIAAFGSVLGWNGVIGPLLFGSLSGGMVGGVLLLAKKKKLGETLPFGPFLCIGLLVTYYYPLWWEFVMTRVFSLNFP